MRRERSHIISNRVRGVSFPLKNAHPFGYACVCMCVSSCARTRARVYVCVCLPQELAESSK